MGLESNIWKLKTDRVLSESLLFVAILVPYLQSIGLRASEIFVVESIFAATLVICEIPTGYFSDIVGRKVSMLIGAVLFPLSSLAYGLSEGFWGVAFAEMLGAVAVSLRSGADSAFLYDTLIELKREKEHKKIEGHFFFLQRVGSSTAHLLGGLLSSLWIRLPFFLSSIIMLARVPLILSMKETKKEPSKKKTPRLHVADMGRAVRYCASHPVLRNAVLYSSFISGINLVGYWSYSLLYTKLGIPLAVFGFLAATASLMAGAGGGLVHKLERKWGERNLVLLPLLTAPSYVLIGWLDSIWALPLIFLNAFLWGLSIPLLRDILHKNTRSNIRATVLSTMSMGGRLGYILIAVGIGYLIDATSLQTGFMALGAVFAVSCAPPVWGLINCDKVR